MVNLFVAAGPPESGFDNRFDTAGFETVEIALLDSKASVVSPVVMLAVFPLFVLTGVVDVVVVVETVVLPVAGVVVPGVHETLVVVVIQPFERFDSVSSAGLSQPERAVETASKPTPKKIRI